MKLRRAPWLAVGLLVLPWWLGSTGCRTAPAVTAPNMIAFNEGEMGRLCVLNTSGWTLTPRPLTVLDNGQQLVVLSRNRYFITPVAGGPHELTVTPGRNPPLRLEVAPGETYYVRVTSQRTAAGPGGTPTTIDTATAAKLLRRMTHQGK